MTHTFIQTSSGFNYNGVSYTDPKITSTYTDATLSIRINEQVFHLSPASENISINGNTFSGTTAQLNTALDPVFSPASTTSHGTLINNATSKTTPVDADQVGLMDSAAGNVLKKLSWANIKAALKAYFDTLYQSGSSQDVLEEKIFTLLIANGVTAAVTTIGMASPSVSGTSTGRTPAATNYFTRRRRMGQVSAASANSNASYRANTYSSGDEGFIATFHFGIAAADAGMRVAVGMKSTTGDLDANTDPSATATSILICADAAETNLKVVAHNGTTSSNASLGSNYPAKTSNTDWYKAKFIVSNGSVQYTVTRTTSTGVQHTITGTLATAPGAGTLLHPIIWCNTGIATNAVAIDFSKFIITPL